MLQEQYEMNTVMEQILDGKKEKGHTRVTQLFGRRRGMEGSFTELERNDVRAFEEGDRKQKFHFEHLKFEVAVIHPVGGDKMAGRKTNLELREVVRARDVNWLHKCVINL